MTHRHCVIGLFLLALAGSVLAAELGYYAQPALHDDHLVFVSEGDLWSIRVSATTGAPLVAHRLTSSDGDESHPVFSPDGAWIAFAGEYDGNTDVYLMPAEGGAPKRLTFHPGADVPLAWEPRGGAVMFKSGRSHHFGRPELWRVSTMGGMPVRSTFGECSMVSVSGTGSRIAFTRWSTENWTWKRYRGGTAPEIWIGDLGAERFHKLTSDAASDMFPMWKLGRVYFLSDRAGVTNIFSDAPAGGDLRQHTSFAADPANATAPEGYDIRWPSIDASRRGSTIVFAQAGGLALLDTADNSIRRLHVRLASDRVAARQRFADPQGTMTDFALSHDGTSLVVESRGELISAPVDAGDPTQLTHTSVAREWGASFVDEATLVLISDQMGEQQIFMQPADGSDAPGPLTESRADWLFPPVASPFGNWIAFGDKTMRLHVLNLNTLVLELVDRSEASEITDYRFSPDGNWIAYTKPMPNGMGNVFIHSLNTRRTFAVSDGLSDDGEPRWDPAGGYLYFIAERDLDPILGDLDFEHVYVQTRKVYVVPLTADFAPPFPAVARAAGFDLDTWSSGYLEEEGIDDAADWTIRIDTNGLTDRHYDLGIDPGNISSLEAPPGAVTFLTSPTVGLLADDFFAANDPSSGDAALHYYDIALEADTIVAEDISGYTISADGTTVAYPAPGGFSVMPAEGGEVTSVDLSASRLRVNMQEEWAQIFEESWRLQRDFYWAPNMVGVDWEAMGRKYRALLPRVGTRAELNDLIGEMIGELGTSHAYIFGGEAHDGAEGVSVGMLAADIEFDGQGHRITGIVPGHRWDEQVAGPLAAPHLGVVEGDYLVGINGIDLAIGDNVYDLLQDQAGREVRLDLADSAEGANRRTIRVTTLHDEGAVRYASWVESNRKYVERVSEGQLGYLHIPDMGGPGLVAFSRLFYSQVNKQGLVIDVRENGGGFVSQMVVRRLAQRPLAYDVPRHGRISRYPQNALDAHLVTLIDQHAGSDGDIFPAAFKALGLGPLIGMRTWGGVVGIRGDKPFVDMGLSTQPEFAWWEAQGGWSIENYGVDPDIELDITPEDRIAGRDPQLDRAIEYLTEKLKQEPRPAPPAPTYPVRVR